MHTSGYKIRGNLQALFTRARPRYRSQKCNVGRDDIGWIAHRDKWRRGTFTFEYALELQQELGPIVQKLVLMLFKDRVII